MGPDANMGRWSADQFNSWRFDYTNTASKSAEVVTLFLLSVFVFLSQHGRLTE
jgi:hypothetical protein